MTGSLVIATSLLAGACTRIFGDENSSTDRLRILVINNSDQPIFNVFTEPGKEAPAGRFGRTRAGESESIGIETVAAALDDEPGGCFESHLWLVRSRSGQSYPQYADIADYADDLEVIRHFGPGECTDQDEIVVEYDGP